MASWRGEGGTTLDWLEARRLLDLSRRVWRGEGGVDAVQQLLDQQSHP